MARPLTEEDRRAQRFLQETERRNAADDRRALRLRGSSAARQRLQDDWEPVLLPAEADAFATLPPWTQSDAPPLSTPRNGPERDDLEELMCDAE